jgi:hypothetical protein
MTAKGPINIPNRQVIKERLMETATLKRAAQISLLPSNARISLAADCWSSPQRQAFLAITGYFIDPDWNYREVLLGFEHLPDSHHGHKLASRVIDVLKRYSLQNRVMAITTDNTGNNHTMMASLQQELREELDDPGVKEAAFPEVVSDLIRSQVHIPCLAHVLQLSCKALLSKLKVDAKNDSIDSNWDNTRDSEFVEKGIGLALEKVGII